MRALACECQYSNSSLSLMEEFTPTFAVMIEPHPVKAEESGGTDERDASPITPFRQNAEAERTPSPATIRPPPVVSRPPVVTRVPSDLPPCCDVPQAPIGEYNPLLILQALSASFAVGALVGVVLHYGFSRPSVSISTE